MSEVGEVKLEYALRGDALLHVSTFAHLRGSSKDRPTDMRCPECDGTVFPVLPFEKADHYRHESESSCWLGGESALHFNAKVALAQEMSRFRQASLVFKCRACANWYPFLHIGPYDKVIPEMKVAARRPDVSCLSGSSVVGIAEVMASHAVSFEKKNELNALGCPWFEIPAINVHRQFFKFVEAADVFSIDATGAGITFPDAPRVCEVCAPEEARRAKNWINLQRQVIERPVGGDADNFNEWRKLAEIRKARTLKEWKEFKALPSPHPRPEDLMVGMGLEAEGVLLEVDEWGLKPSTPKLDTITYIWLVNERKERWLARNRRTMAVEEE